MKKKILFVALFLVATVASFQMGTKHEKLDSLMLENIEALASGEGGTRYDCFGIGSVDCPLNHVKVYFVASF
ncbi:NVEALA domain-containing protein [Bacteroides sp.]|uniref:NVEALA domain-containing protein n=1 Tax=Bacteroides sp. TaxID=29523 RepID=UPI0023BCFDAA|nr:NVEALA domain-containing protein [Bacteroides sp.]MDE6217145.1 NVEALA domain-containing protein [Bacteroides sp.]